ncbi:MAG: hypothetical protein AB1633_12470, partial [Elusimicrobiota bacterium]
DIIKIFLFTAISFPILLLVLLFITGYIRYEIGPEKDKLDVKIEPVAAKGLYDDSIAIQNSKTYKALINKQLEIEKEMEKLESERRRLDEFKNEINKDKENFIKSKLELENLIARSHDSQQKRIRQLADIYAVMRPDNAAPILQTLNEQLIADILLQIKDKGQTAKILAKFEKERAGRVSKLISELEKKKK